MKSKKLPLRFGMETQQQLQDPTHRETTKNIKYVEQKDVTKLFGSCRSKADGEMFSLEFSDVTTKQNLFQRFGHFLCSIYISKSKTKQLTLDC